MSRLHIYDMLDPKAVVQPFKTPYVESKARVEDSESWVEVLYGDTHLYPGQDDTVAQILLSILQDLQPDGVTHMGDLLDVASLKDVKKYGKDAREVWTLQDEIDMGRTHLEAVTGVVPKARRTFLEGNHEDRLRRTVWGAMEGPEVLFGLDIVKPVLTWPRLLHLGELGWEFHSYITQPVNGLPKFLRKHGTRVRQHSAYTARAELERYRKSGASGHTHRMGVHMASDHNGDHIWIETGCCCSRQAWYGNEPDQNWQQGFVVMGFDTATGAFHPELVYVRDGRAFFRGNMYTAH